MGGSKVSLPPPSPVDAELQREQVNLLKQQSSILNEQFRLQNLLTPTLLRAQGLKPKLDESGKIIGLEEDPGSIQMRRLGLEEKFIERSEKALAGELDIDPALTRGLQEEEQTIRGMLRKQVGPDYELSTPGSQRLGDFFKRKEELLYAARRGDLTLSEQLGLARQGSVQGGVQGGQNVLFGMPLNLASAFGGASASYNDPLNRGQNERQLQLQAAIENSRQSSARTASLVSGISSAVGTSLGAYAALK